MWILNMDNPTLEYCGGEFMVEDFLHECPSCGGKEMRLLIGPDSFYYYQCEYCDRRYVQLHRLVKPVMKHYWIPFTGGVLMGLQAFLERVTKG